MDWIEVLVLGLVQGLTEFLPVSSDGHLAVVNFVFARIRGVARKDSEDVFVDVMLHFGTTVAILVHYRQQILAAIRGFQGTEKVADEYTRPALLRLCGLIFVASLPLAI